MADPCTARLNLPYLVVAQAQKEVTHNEALALLDMAVQPSIVAVSPTEPATPALGQCWVIGAGATGNWAGEDNALVQWTEGGWRFMAPLRGFMVWDNGQDAALRFDGAAWVLAGPSQNGYFVAGQQILSSRAPAIADPVGGAVHDVEVRAAVTTMLAALRSHGLIAT